MPSAALINLSHVRVLCVDDDPVMRAVIRGALQRQGCRDIVQAEGGRQALHSCAARAFDLIICDYQMEPMHGLAFLQALCGAGLGAGWPVIMLSAETDPATIAAAHHLGVSAWVSKPVSALKLMERIGAVLGRRRGESTCGQLQRRMEERYHAQLLVGVAALEEELTRMAYHQRDIRPVLRQAMSHFDTLAEKANTAGYELVAMLASRGAGLIRAADADPALAAKLHGELGRALMSLATAMKRVASNRMAGDGGVGGLRLLDKLDASVAALRSQFQASRGTAAAVEACPVRAG